MSSLYVIALGGNLGDVKETFKIAIENIASQLGKIERISSLYQTNPLPTKAGIIQPLYLNAAILLRSSVDPSALLESLIRIEEKLGRKREEVVHWGPRSIDLDIISVDENQINLPNLQIPHPRMHERDFVIIPFMEVWPEWIHPSTQKNLSEMLSEIVPENRYIKENIGKL